MTSCRCTAVKHATASLESLDGLARITIGVDGREGWQDFNRYLDAYRLVFYLRRGWPLNGFKDLRELHAAVLSGLMNIDDLESMDDAMVAFAIFKAETKGKRSAGDLIEPDDNG